MLGIMKFRKSNFIVFWVVLSNLGSLQQNAATSRGTDRGVIGSEHVGSEASPVIDHKVESALAHESQRNTGLVSTDPSSVQIPGESTLNLVKRIEFQHLLKTFREAKAAEVEEALSVAALVLAVKVEKELESTARLYLVESKLELLKANISESKKLQDDIFLKITKVVKSLDSIKKKSGGGLGLEVIEEMRLSLELNLLVSQIKEKREETRLALEEEHTLSLGELQVIAESFVSEIAAPDSSGKSEFTKKYLEQFEKQALATLDFNKIEYVKLEESCAQLLVTERELGDLLSVPSYSPADLLELQNSLAEKVKAYEKVLRNLLFSLEEIASRFSTVLVNTIALKEIKLPENATVEESLAVASSNFEKASQVLEEALFFRQQGNELRASILKNLVEAAEYTGTPLSDYSEQIDSLTSRAKLARTQLKEREQDLLASNRFDVLRSLDVRLLCAEASKKLMEAKTERLDAISAFGTLGAMFDENEKLLRSQFTPALKLMLDCRAKVSLKLIETEECSKKLKNTPTDATLQSLFRSVEGDLISLSQEEASLNKECSQLKEIVMQTLCKKFSELERDVEALEGSLLTELASKQAAISYITRSLRASFKVTLKEQARFTKNKGEIVECIARMIYKAKEGSAATALSLAANIKDLDAKLLENFKLHINAMQVETFNAETAQPEVAKNILNKLEARISSFKYAHIDWAVDTLDAVRGMEASYSLEQLNLYAQDMQEELEQFLKNNEEELALSLAAKVEE
jgi:hypothetical protein